VKNRKQGITHDVRWRTRVFAGAWGFVILCLLLAVTATVSPAQNEQPSNVPTFTTLVNFDGTNGASPYLVTLLQGTDGDLYGTTSGYGYGSDGTVFKMTPCGRLTTLHSFNGTDGANPVGGLLQAVSGSLYGVANLGGAKGYGTVFKMSPSGTLVTLYSFVGYPTDGSQPLAALVQATDGKFYGTTVAGGTENYGTVFKITPRGTQVTLYSFCAQTNCTDGANPYAALVQATDGNFYGTAFYGGAYYYDGTVFKITPGGILTTLHSFDCTDGCSPEAGLIQGSDGNFYGTTTYGGTSSACFGGCGTVFRITPGGTLTTLHSFDGADGNGPQSLVQATDGNFYGTTTSGGTFNDGTIFKITPGGTLTTLHCFDGNHGAIPYGGLVQDTSGTFYGTADRGGTGGYGTVFSLAVGLGPFLKTLPASGKVGTEVAILGNNLSGTTSITFNDTSVTSFTVNSTGTAITTTVPPGAITGFVKVTTPSVTLTSNVKFRVLP
jgi:uncharacterized repeat protein (TIGR03803 family)